MSRHPIVQDKSVSIIRGIPLSEEAGLGELTLPGYIREVAERFREREALVQRRPDGTMERWSYRDLWDHSMEVAKALIGCELGKGERVGVLMTNRAEFLSAVFGSALAGGIAVPLSTFSTSHELDYLVASSACSMLLLERHVLKKDFSQILCDLEPAIGTASPGRLASLKFPFLRRLAMVDERRTEGGDRKLGRLPRTRRRGPGGAGSGAGERCHARRSGGAVLLLGLHQQTEGNSERASRRHRATVAHAAPAGAR